MMLIARVTGTSHPVSRRVEKESVKRYISSEGEELCYRPLKRFISAVL
jgi:hypothetical protein